MALSSSRLEINKNQSSRKLSFIMLVIFFLKFRSSDILTRHVFPQIYGH